MAKVNSVQEVEVALLQPYENNAKIHGKDQIEKLKNSIQEFGFLTPCLIDRDYNLIAGHGRVIAAKELGLKTIPCVFIEGLTEEQRKAYILVDNRLAELAGWDYELLDQELDGIEEIDMSQYGFDILESNIDLDDFFAEADEREKEAKRIQCPHCGEWFEL